MDLVLRCLILFPLVVVLVRIVNRRELSSLEPFDVVLLVVIGDLLQQGITQSDYSVTGAAIVVTTITLLSALTAYLNWRIPLLRTTLEGEPIILLENGRPIERNLRRQRITMAELAAQARLATSRRLRACATRCSRRRAGSASSPTDDRRADRDREGGRPAAVIVTAGDAVAPAGCLVGFATQASIHPPRMLVCLSVVNATYRRARRSRVLGVHLVPAGRRDLAELFGEETADDGTDKFAACAWTPGPAGVPLLDGCPAWFAGTIVRWLPLGDHTGALLDPIAGPAAATPEPALRLLEAGPLHPGHPA